MRKIDSSLNINKWFEETDKLGMCSADGLKKRIDSLQAKVDSLMLEFCPEDMTEDQLNNWKSKQNSFRK